MRGTKHECYHRLSNKACTSLCPLAQAESTSDRRLSFDKSGRLTFNTENPKMAPRTTTDPNFESTSPAKSRTSTNRLLSFIFCAVLNLKGSVQFKGQYMYVVVGTHAQCPPI